LPTDLHGLARIEDGEIGLSVMGYAFLPLSHPAISLSSPEECGLLDVGCGLDGGTFGLSFTCMSRV